MYDTFSISVTCGKYTNAERSVNIFTLPCHTCKIPTVCTIFSVWKILWRIGAPFLTKWIWDPEFAKKDSIYSCPNLLQIIKFLGRKKRYILSVGMGKATNSCCQKAHKNVKMHCFIKKHTYQQNIKSFLLNYHYPRNYWWNFNNGLCNHNKDWRLHSFRKKNHMKKSSLTYVWISWHRVKMTVHWN